MRHRQGARAIALALAWTAIPAMAAEDAVIPQLFLALRHFSPEIRRQAAEQLGEPGTQPRVVAEALTRALLDREPQVRAAAAESLGRIGPPAAPAARTALLRVVVRDPDIAVARKAATAIRSLHRGKGPSVDELLAHRKRERGFAELVALDWPAPHPAEFKVPETKTMPLTPELAFRRARLEARFNEATDIPIVSAVAERESGAPVPYWTIKELEHRLEFGSPDKRFETFRHLMNWGTPEEVEPYVVRALFDGPGPVRTMAIRYLRDREEAGIMPQTLADLLNRKGLKDTAIQSLALQLSRTTFGRLVIDEICRRRPEMGFRASEDFIAAVVRLNVRTPDSRSFLYSMLESERLFPDALAALRELEMDETVFSDRIRPLLTSDEESQRLIAATLTRTVSLDVKRDVPFLAKRATVDSSVDVRSRITEELLRRTPTSNVVVDALVRQLRKDSSPRIRRQAATAIDSLPSKVREPHVDRLYEVLAADKDTAVRLVVAKTLHSQLAGNPQAQRVLEELRVALTAQFMWEELHAITRDTEQLRDDARKRQRAEFVKLVAEDITEETP